MEPTDETLCAYMDGELSLEERRDVERALARSPDARARLVAMREADRRVQSLVPATQVQIDPLAARIRAASGRSASRGARAHWAPVALAAGVAGLAIGLAPAALRDQRSGEAFLSPQIERALQSLAGGGQTDGIRIVSTFLARDESVCREFTVHAAETDGEGIACRQGEHWRTVAWVAAPKTDAKAYITAGADNALDAVIERLDASGPVSADAEAALKRNGWRKAPK